MIKKISQKFYKIINSKKFFYFVIAILFIQAAWFALSAQYPMAFDENYHFGLIQFYSHQLSPFITKAPASAAVFGEITRFDSYLYHYLMSFPYRLIALFIHNQVAQIIILRFINIGIFIGGILLFRRLFRKLKISNGLINISTLVLSLIPVVPFLAATISYDNLIFLLVPIVAILGLNCRDGIVNKSTIPTDKFLLLLIAGSLGSLVKYAFLPIFAAVLIYLLIIFVRKTKKIKLLKTIVSSFTRLKIWLKIVLIIGIIISGGLFTERYGVNLLQYHSIEPDCGKIQSKTYCLQYGAWARNNRIASEVAVNNTPVDPPVILFTPAWLLSMDYRLFFAINSNYATGYPLPIPIAVATIIGIFGTILLVIYNKFLIRLDRRLLLFGGIIILYISSIFYKNFTEYLHYRTILAVNGRYLIPILLLFFVLIGLAYRQFFYKIFKNKARSFVAIFSIVIILLLLQGGGALTYLIRGRDSSWYWQNQTVIDINNNLKKIITPLVIDSFYLQGPAQ